jgi:uncharacterized membrane protein
MAESHTVLTRREKNTCEYLGVAGALLSAACFVQHIALAIPSYLTYPMIPAYVFAVICFICLALQQPLSVILLIISAVFTFAIEYIYITHFSFSLLVILLLLYQVITLVLLYNDSIPKKLKMKRAAEKAEKDEWAGKI